MKLLKLFVLTMGLLVTTLSMADITVQSLQPTSPNIGFEAFSTLYPNVAEISVNLSVKREQDADWLASISTVLPTNQLTSSVISKDLLGSEKLKWVFNFSSFPFTMVVKKDIYDLHNPTDIIYTCSGKIVVNTKEDLDRTYVLQITDLKAKDCSLRVKN
jgi:hypothetical protein